MRRHAEGSQSWPVAFQTHNLLHSQFFASLRWLALLAQLTIAVGSASAFFLWALDAVTRVRFAYPGLLFLLPIAGLCVGMLYHPYGKSTDGGNNLLIGEIHQPGVGVPKRMALSWSIEWVPASSLTHTLHKAAGIRLAIERWQAS